MPKSKLRITTSWTVLFKYASKAGKARMKYKDDPNETNKIEMDEAIKRHSEYQDLCLEADRMIGLEGILN